MPAQSPTLSPTLSAITAGLRGSSSGMPASTLPTKSAPTSAPLVKMPPPRRAKMEMREAPKASPIMGFNSSAKGLSGVRLPLPTKNQKKPTTPSKPNPTTSMPVTAPPRNATSRAGPMPRVAAWAVRTLALTEMFMPIKPHAPDSTAPSTKPMAVLPSRKTPINTAKATPTHAMVLYWRAR